MSLIDEALKRARQEAAVQDAAQREAQFRRVPVYAPPPRRSNRASSGNGLLMAGAGTLAGAVLVLALAFFAGWLPAGKGAPAGLQAAASPAPPAPLSVPRVVEVTEGPKAAPSRAAAPEERRPTPARPRETPAAVSETRPAAAAPSPSPAPAPPPVAATPAPAAPAPVEQAPAPSVENVPGIPPAAEPVSRSYVREVPVPGGGSLVLSGIAFSAERPVALLNGRPMVPGEAIEGFTVVAIEPGGVRLDGHGQKVLVTLH